MLRTLILLSLLVFFTSCSNTKITGETIKEIPKEINKWPAVYFCPGDNCSKILTDVLDSAESSVYCAFFDLGLEEIKNILVIKNNEIDVKLVIDNENYDKIKNIKLKNIKQDNSNQLTHNKFCIIDKKIVTTGSFNPTERGAYKNNNNLIIFYSEYLAENYLDEFEELWNGDFGSGNKVRYPIVYLNNKKIENYFCPEDDCKGRVINVLRKARKIIYFMTFSFTEEDIADAILFKDQIDIKGIFEKTQAGSQYSQYHRLEGFKLDVKVDSNPANMHHKVFIIDNQTVITGSYNPTGAGSYKNDENIVIIHDKDIAKMYLEEFEEVFY